MKKIQLLALLFAVFFLSGNIAFAQAKTKNNKTTRKTTKVVEKKSEKKADKKIDKPAEKAVHPKTR